MPHDLLGEKLKAALAAGLRVLQTLRIRHALFGGVAVNLLGCFRFTDDVDLIVDVGESEVEAFLEALRTAGFELPPGAADRFRRDAMLPARYHETKVDFLGAADPLSAETLAQAREDVAFGQPVPVARPEQLIVLKMLPRRHQDMIDIQALLVRHRGAIDLALVRRWMREIEDIAPGAIDLFEKLVREFHDPLPETGHGR